MKGSTYEPKQPFHVNLEFESASEAADLAAELMTWTPTGGWSSTARYLFQLLKDGVLDDSESG